jgi:hypothetical protein
MGHSPCLFLSFIIAAFVFGFNEEQRRKSKQKARPNAVTDSWDEHFFAAEPAYSLPVILSAT